MGNQKNWSQRRRRIIFYTNVYEEGNGDEEATIWEQCWQLIDIVFAAELLNTIEYQTPQATMSECATILYNHGAIEEIPNELARPYISGQYIFMNIFELQHFLNFHITGLGIIGGNLRRLVHDYRTDFHG